MTMKYSMTETSNGLSVNATVGKDPDGHFKFPHFWPVKLPHGRTVGL
jgi:hypothetical protein